MHINWVNMELFSCLRVNPKAKNLLDENDAWNFGSYQIIKQGPSLLKDNCALQVQVERNLDGDISKIGNKKLTNFLMSFD